MKIIKNTDSFRFAIRKFRHIGTGRRWWLINLVFWTIITNNYGEKK